MIRMRRGRCFPIFKMSRLSRTLGSTVGSQSYPTGPACKLRCDLLGGTGSTGGCTCPAAAQAETTDQCILVTLAGNVDFGNDSIRRNMEIESASNFERNAQINIQGLPPIGT